MTVTLMMMVALAVYQSLSNGLRVWERSRLISPEEDVYLFFDRFREELSSAFNYSLFDFEGDSQAIVFTSLVRVPLGQSDSRDIVTYADQVGRVEYGFDYLEKSIYRKIAYYGQAVEGDFGRQRVLASPIQDLRFSYYKQSDAGLTLWKLDQDDLPDVVEVEVEFLESGGGRRTLSAAIDIPAAGYAMEFVENE
ncbi:MAG: hypothetical protein ACLFPX_04045 [Candidatus Omnitrophota bacterium]